MRISDWSSDVCSSDLQIDYDREMAFIATAPAAADGGEEALGVVRTATDPDNQKAEFAIVVRSDVKRQGLGRALMNKMIGYSRSRGTGVMVGDILRGNAGMQALAQAFGFRVVRTDEDVVQVELSLRSEEHTSELQSQMPTSYA